jgi:hypothetical protein
MAAQVMPLLIALGRRATSSVTIASGAQTSLRIEVTP